MQSIEEAKVALKTAWPLIKSECLSVLGSELHYQAMIYHALRTDGRVPANQIGMNVKMWIDNPVSELFKRLSDRKHENYRRGFEPIPDVVSTLLKKGNIISNCSSFTSIMSSSSSYILSFNS